MRGNFENEVLNSVSIDQVYDRIASKLKNDQIDMKGFSDLYGGETISRDLAYVQKMEDKFTSENNPDLEKAHKLATVFEGIFNEQAELSDWLGSDVVTMKTSRFDDIANGIDSLAEFRETETAASYLGLAIDVTTAQDLAGKFGKIKKDIENGELGRVKYFFSEYTNVRGEMKNVPRVVIGADRRTVGNLSETWAAKDKKALANHFIQFQILEEISAQLSVFSEYARSVNQSALAEVYRKTGEKIMNILVGKRKQILDSGERDSVFAAIENQVSALKILSKKK